MRLRDAAFMRSGLAAPREPHEVSCVHVTRAVNVRLSLCSLICHALSFVARSFTNTLRTSQGGCQIIHTACLPAYALAETQVSSVSNQLYNFEGCRQGDERTRENTQGGGTCTQPGQDCPILTRVMSEEHGVVVS